VLVEPETLGAVLEVLEARPDVGAVTCRLLLPTGNIDPACRRSEPTAVTALAKQLGLSRLFPRSRVLGRYNLTYLTPSETHEIDSGTGAFLLLRRSALDAAGGRLDERFFLYGEDLDLCRRIRQAGYRILYWPGVTALHVKGSGRIRDARTTLHFYRAMWIYYRKWGRFSSNPLVLAGLGGGLVVLGTAELARNAIRRTLRTGRSM
jgi:GT2 family glycosyltransferase